ncbi:uncharacterized protein ARMOST_14995 [Armillaria ostoyae]|uniref:Uncharacterized protein n=1 Tax=Armillaria ostoyae TaxID=47428 RepID=A0A284RS54_ARMOS|nr:uncharacterized protein ARMOST_14995 [Armillaria ostoyae]
MTTIIPFLAIFLIPVWFIVGGRLSKAKGPIIATEFGFRAFRWPELYLSAYPYSPSYPRAAIQKQDLIAWRFLLRLQLVFCKKRKSNRTELCNAPNAHIEDLRVPLELAGSIKKYQEAQETYNSGFMKCFTPGYLLGLLFKKPRVAAESVYGQNIGGAVVSNYTFLLSAFWFSFITSLLIGIH